MNKYENEKRDLHQPFSLSTKTLYGKSSVFVEF